MVKQITYNLKTAKVSQTQNSASNFNLPSNKINALERWNQQFGSGEARQINDPISYSFFRIIMTQS